jgi:L-asparaginase
MSQKPQYRIFDLKYSGQVKSRASILIVYTGGTIGMVHDDGGALVSLNFNQIIEKVPTLRTLDLKLTVISFPEPFDSSNVKIDNWLDLAGIIYENYRQYDGFIVLHGTDTMAFTASALSFLLEGLTKPVIFTGAQLPVSAVRSDAWANLVSALEIAAAKKDGIPVVPEVCIYFDYQLMRANRTFKKRSNQFAAFGCENYPILAKTGITINYNEPAIMPYRPDAELILHPEMCPDIFILKIFPSIRESYLRHVVEMPGLKGLILETFGSGNAPTDTWFLAALKMASDKGIVLYNVSQLIGGMVMHGRYETSKYLDNVGVVSGRDITREAAVAKLMFLLAEERDIEILKSKLGAPIRGEMTI